MKQPTYHEDDWDDMNQDVEYEAPTSFAPVRSRPLVRQSAAKSDKPQDRTPKPGHEHYPLRNVPTKTMDYIRSLAAREERSLNWELVRILNEFVEQHKAPK